LAICKFSFFIIPQQKLVKEIEILETQITIAQNVIDNAAVKKQRILKKWLE
jgi:hypothetical protein